MPEIKMIAKGVIGLTILLAILLAILAPFIFAAAHPAIAIVAVAAVIAAAVYLIRRKRQRNLV